MSTAQKRTFHLISVNINLNRPWALAKRNWPTQPVLVFVYLIPSASVRDPQAMSVVCDPGPKQAACFSRPRRMAFRARHTTSQLTNAAICGRSGLLSKCIPFHCIPSGSNCGLRCERHITICAKAPSNYEHRWALGTLRKQTWLTGAVICCHSGGLCHCSSRNHAFP